MMLRRTGTGSESRRRRSRVKREGAGRLLCAAVGLLWAAALFFALPAVRAEAALKVSLPKTVKGYTPCDIRIEAPADGEVELHLYDALKNCWLIRREPVAAGENTLSWDGLGANQERMFAGPYHFGVTLRTPAGEEYTATAKFKISDVTPTLVYALPSSETLYLDQGERWFTEVYTSAPCIITMEVSGTGGETVFAREEMVEDEDGMTVRWTGALKGAEKIAPGRYTVTFRSKLNPSWTVSFPLTVEENTPASPEPGPTGPILPERGMSDEEIWEIMMKPSFVVEGVGSYLTVDLKSEPRTRSKTVGTLRCALQGLEILDVDGSWAHVRAWSHQGGRELTGYIQRSRLTVFTPGPHYGVLVDKREQTLTLFRDGRSVATVPVSTGLPTRRKTYRETPPGAFLTDVHYGASFAQAGYRYEYPLRYDAGNIIHGLGFIRKGRVRDYSTTLSKLGQKASHGCVRVSSFLAEGEFLNIYWLWTHLPYHTRVIILPD